jgi:hypothetical protein
VSTAKTMVFFSKNIVSSNLARIISSESGFVRTEDQRINKQTYAYIIENKHQKLAGWNRRIYL